MAAKREMGLGVRFYGRLEKALANDITRLNLLLGKLNRSFATYTNAQKAVGAATKTTTAAVTAGAKGMTDYQKVMNSSTGETKAFKTAMGQLAKQHGESGTAFRVQAARLKEAEKAIMKHADALRNNTALGKNATKTGNAYAETTDRIATMNDKAAKKIRFTNQGIEKMAPAMKTAGKATKDLSKKKGVLNKQISKVEGGWSQLMAAFKVTASYGIAATAIYSVINAFKQGIAVMTAFDQALKNLQAITRATDAELTIMGDKIKDVANRTKFSAQEVSSAMVLLGQAGFSAAESIDAVEAVSLLATGTMTDLATTADLMTTAIRAFGLDAADSARIADIFASAVNGSKLTIDKLRTAFNYIGPIANKAGLTLEDTASATMVLANSGLRASTIGTGLRQVLSRLVAPSDKLREAFVAAGADLAKLNPRTSKFSDIIGELTKVVPTAQRAFELFGLRGAAAVSALTEAGVEGFGEMKDKVLGVGSAARMADKQLEGLAFKAKNLADKAGLLAIAIGEGGLITVFKGLIDSLRTVMELLAALVDNWLGRIIALAPIAGFAIFGLVKGLRMLSVALFAVGTGVKAASITALSGHLASAGVAVGGLRMAIMGLWATTKKFFAFLMKNPIILIATLIAGVVIALKELVAATDEARVAAETHEAQMKRELDTLLNYRTALMNTAKGSKEYGSMLERLTNEYKALLPFVDKVNNRFKDQGKAFQELIDKKVHEHFKSVADSMNSVLDQITRLERQIFVSSLRIAVAYDAIMKKDYEKALAEQTEALKNLHRELEGYAITLGEVRDWDFTTSAEEIVRTLEAYTDANDELIKSVAESLRKHYAESEKHKQKEIALYKEVGQVVPDLWKKMLDEVDIYRQADILKAKKAMNAEIGMVAKAAEDAGMNLEHIYALKKAIRLKWLIKVKQMQADETQGEVEAAQERVAIVQNAASETDAMRELQLKKAQEDYEAKLAIKDLEATQYVALMEEYIATVKDIEAQYAGERSAVRNATYEAEQNLNEKTLALHKAYADLRVKLGFDTDKQIEASQKAMHENLDKLARQIPEKAAEIEETRRAIHQWGNEAIIKDWREKEQERLSILESNLEVELDKIDAAVQKKTITEAEGQQKRLDLEKAFWAETSKFLDEWIVNVANTYGIDTEEHKAAIRTKMLASQEFAKSEQTTLNQMADDRKAFYEKYIQGEEKTTQDVLDEYETRREEFERHMEDMRVSASDYQTFLVENEKMQTKELAAVWKTKYDERRKLLKANMDQEIALIDIALAKQEVTVDEHAKKKLEIELEFWEAVVELATANMEVLNKLVDEGSVVYVEATKAKLEAELALQAVKDKILEKIEESGQVSDDAAKKEKKRLGAAREGVESLMKDYSRLVREMSAPIEIKIDTDPAKAAIESLVIGFKEKIATMMKLWADYAYKAQQANSRVAKYFRDAAQSIGIGIEDMKTRLKGMTDLISDRWEMNVDFKGTGSTTKPLGDKINEMVGKLLFMKDTYEEPITVDVQFEGTGSTTTALGDKIAELKDKYLSFRDELQEEVRAHVSFVSEEGQEGLVGLLGQAIDLLKSKINELGQSLSKQISAFQGVTGEMGSLDQRYHDDLRSLRQKTMTDEQKWNDDRKEANRLMNEGIKDNDKAMVQKAYDMFRSLAREVKDEAGETVKTLEDTIKVAEEGMATGYKAWTKVLKDEQREIADAIGITQGKIGELNDEIGEYGSAMIDAQNGVQTTVYATMDTVDKLGQRIADLTKEINESNPAFVTDFIGYGSDEKPISEKVGEVGNMVSDLAKSISSGGATMVIRFVDQAGRSITDAVDDIRKQVGSIGGTISSGTFTTSSQTSGIVERVGPRSSGGVSGYNPYNQGYVPAVQGGTLNQPSLTGQLHTIDLRVNNEPHTVYSTESTFNQLTGSLRRAALTRS